MEEGGKVGADALVNTPGGGSVHSSQKVGGAASASTTTIENGVKSITIGSGPVQMGGPKPAAAAAVYVKDERCQALWTDGKFYLAQVMKVEGGGKYSVKYLEYGNVKAGLTGKELKKETAAPQTAKPAAGKPAAAAKQQPAVKVK
jgi:hypothetical protein